MVAQLLAIVLALGIAALSAWATLRAFAAFKTQPTPLMLTVLLGWFVPVIGPIVVLVLAKREVRAE